jgi:hypothetical protein
MSEKTSHEVNYFQPPLWYQVAHHQLSFEEFDRRFSDSHYKESEILPIFIFAALYKHNPYLNGEHVLKRQFNPRLMTDRTFSCFYLYWTMAGEFNNDTLIEEYSNAGTFNDLRIHALPDFDDDYIYGWTTFILRSLFNVGAIHHPTVEYEPRNREHLQTALTYGDELHNQSIRLDQKNIKLYYRLAAAHKVLLSIKDFLLGKSFPAILQPYRKDSLFFQSLVYTYWPGVLATAEQDTPFTEEEKEYIKQAQEELHESADLDFITEYTSKMKHAFGEDHSFTIQMKEYLKPSNQTDALRIKSTLFRLSPEERRIYFGQYLPVYDHQLELFLKNINETSFEKAFCPYLQANIKRFEQEIELTGIQLCNQRTMASQLDYYCYNLEDLIFHIEGQYMYIFLPEELFQLTDRNNPYTRVPLPKKIFEGITGEEETTSLEDLWETILKRRVDLVALVSQSGVK